MTLREYESGRSAAVTAASEIVPPAGISTISWLRSAGRSGRIGRSICTLSAALSASRVRPKRRRALSRPGAGSGTVTGKSSRAGRFCVHEKLCAPAPPALRPSAEKVTRPAPPGPSTTRPISPASNVSPGRAKRGSAGCATSSWRTSISPVAKPKRSGPLTALARSLKTVSESGSFTLNFAVPSAPTTTFGR